MLTWLKNLFKCKRKPRRVELRFVSYADAEDLILEGWQVAKEEDTNKLIGFVYLELLDPKP